jgi:hypothetical protein
MKEYALACLAGVWLADGVALLTAPRVVMNQVREIVLNKPGIFRWQILAVAAGFALVVLGLDLRYKLLWIIAGLGMTVKGLFLWLGSGTLRDQLIEWCLTRENVDYRFWGLGLCTLAVLLLHALGWIGRL